MKKNQKNSIFFLAIFSLILCFSTDVFSCTSLIISGRRTVNGRPLMMKHRDTGNLNNRVEYFRGPFYGFLAVTDAPKKNENIDIKIRKNLAAWTGANEVGFCIMNTASYNIKDDDIPQEKMDREGEFMFNALGVCESLCDFENYLDTLSRPMGVEANFGVIDAEGGAAYYEVNNHTWVKFDVNNSEVAPMGYMVETNFSRTGRIEDRLGVERFYTAEAIFGEIMSEQGILCQEQIAVQNMNDFIFDLKPIDIFDKFSRSYKHVKLGVDYRKNYDAMIESGFFNGIAVDQDFIPRRITSCSVVYEGVKPGEDAQNTVMWTLLGYPACSVAIPLMPAFIKDVPFYMAPYMTSNSSLNKKKLNVSEGHSIICDIAMYIKMNFVYSDRISNGSKYIDLRNVLKGSEYYPSLLSCCQKSEEEISNSFYYLLDMLKSGDLPKDKFFELYNDALMLYIDIYKSNFSSFIR